MLNAATQSKSSDGSLPVSQAVRIAWAIWTTLLIVPFLLFIYVVWQVSDSENATAITSRQQTWFLASSIYLVAIVPLSFFIRSRLFRAYWAGNCVQPEKYLFGMTSVWVALEIGGILSLIGCLITHKLLPELIPALVAFMFFVTFFPTGRAMVKPVGHSEDPSTYEEPS